MIVGVQLSSGNSAPNSGNNHHLTIPSEGGMRSFKRQGACVFRNGRYESEPPLKPSPLTCYKQFWNEPDYHVDVCRITMGAHIEHL